MNSFNKNKEVISICKNYYTIVNSEVYKNDRITHNMIKLYKSYIFNIENITIREREKMISIDNIMYKFITDIKFKKDICDKLKKLSVPSRINDLVEYTINKIIEYFEEYKDTLTRNIYIPRWI